MANIIYVNVGGTWKTVSNYYVNVSGTWKTGTAFQNNVSGTWKGTAAPTSATFPTALDVAKLDYAEFMCLPNVQIASKQGIDGDSLDVSYWLSSPTWFRESEFVYTAPPAPGPSTLPTVSNILGLDTAYWQSSPIAMFSISGSARMDDLDVAEFLCIPHWGLTPTAPSSSPPATPELPTSANIETLDYAEFMCIPFVSIASKQGINGDSLDTSYWLSYPTWFRESEFVYVAPPAPGPSTLPTAANIKTLDIAYWQSAPTVHVVSKSTVNGASLDNAEFMCIPHFTRNL